MYKDYRKKKNIFKSQNNSSEEFKYDVSKFIIN